MYVLAGLLVLGFLCNLMVRPLADKYFMTEQELAHEKQLARERDAAAAAGGQQGVAGVSGVAGTNPAIATFAWAAVGIPLMMGVWITLQKAVVLFN
jgi:hypothetical protein